MAEGRRIVWLHVLTVVSVAILIGAEVFGAAFASSWALATLFGLGHLGRACSTSCSCSAASSSWRSSSAPRTASSRSPRAAEASRDRRMRKS